MAHQTPTKEVSLSFKTLLERQIKNDFTNRCILLTDILTFCTEGRTSGGSASQRPERPNHSPPEDRDDTRGSEKEQRGRQHDNVTQLQEPQAPVATSINSLSVKLRGHKRKSQAQVEESSSGEDEDEEPTVAKTPVRSHALSPASSSHSAPPSEQVLRSSPKTRRTEVRVDATESSGASVKDLEQAMSKHLPSATLTKPESPVVHQPTDFSTDTLLKQQQQRSTIQWIGAHHHLGHLSPQQSSSLSASALLRQFHANRESVIRANVHGIAASGTRAPSSGSAYYTGETPQNGPLPTPPGSEGSSTYGEHQFALAAHNQKGETISFD